MAKGIKNQSRKFQTKDKLEDSKLPSYYVGIGASAGGLEALEDFFINAPVNNGMAFIVVQHLSPDYKSMMVELLARKTKMKVVQITDGMFPEADCIHLIPPQKNLTIFHSQLVLTEQIRGNSLNLPIDIFFRSLAVDQKKKAVGIILSGTGSDGSLGIKAIKEQGGLIMAQDFLSAKFDGMPKSAIATGLVDYVVDAKWMCDKLVKHINHPKILQIDNVKEDEKKEETSYVKILSLVRNNTDIDFSYYKPKTILRRIERRISINQLQDYEEYIKLLLSSKEECEILSREFLIGVTQFFRDAEAYKILENKVIPEIFKNAEQNQPIRIWSVGCSTGEEAYSLAILFSEYMRNNDIKADLKIFATDLGKEAIRDGGLGIYPQNIVADVSKDLLNKYFVNRQDNYQINETVRQMVIFANHNVTTDPPFSKISLVVCRNLLIYFNNEIQTKVQNMFQYSLAQGGFMFLGSSESIIGTPDAFEVIDTKWKIFKYKEGYANVALSNLIAPQLPKRTVVSEITRTNDTSFVKVNPLIYLYEKVLNYFAPSGVIIDSNNTIIHFFKDIKRFLTFPEGKATFNLLELADPQLTMVLSNMLFKARKEKKEITLSKFKYKEFDKNLLLNISAKIISEKKSTSEFVVISINESKNVEKNTDSNAEEFDFNEQAAERIRDLEREIIYRDENLQTTIEELETSNEELQATNEELVSSNEELQSTNEELQSVNEELYTVNSQYQEKITELTELHNDVSNLLANTNIGTLFLDSKLIVRKFTSEIKRTINVMDVDIGRPFSHLTYNCKFTGLLEKVTSVLESLVKEEVEVLANDDQWYLLRIQPYRHSDNSIHGVIITQININDLQKSRLSNLKLHQAVEQSAVGTLITDLDGNIEYVNEKYRNISGYSSKELIGKNPRIFKSGYHDISFYQNIWKTIKSGKAWKGKICNKHKKGSIFWESAIISPIKDHDNNIINFIAVKEDITRYKSYEDQLKVVRTIIETIEKENNGGSWVLNIKTKKLTLSPNTYTIFGLSPETVKPTFDSILQLVHKDDRAVFSKKFSEAIQKHTNFKLLHRLTLPNGEIRTVEEVATVIKDDQDILINVISIVKDITDLVKTKQELTDKHEEIMELQGELDLNTKKYKKQKIEMNLLIDTLPFAFSFNKIILDKTKKPKDYRIIEVNKTYETLAGLSKQGIENKTLSQLNIKIEKSLLDNLASVALRGETYDFTYYSEHLKKSFFAHAYSPAKGFFAVIYKDTK